MSTCNLSILAESTCLWIALNHEVAWRVQAHLIQGIFIGGSKHAAPAIPANPSSGTNAGVARARPSMGARSAARRACWRMCRMELGRRPEPLLLGPLASRALDSVSVGSILPLLCLTCYACLAKSAVCGLLYPIADGPWGFRATGNTE